MVRQRQLFITGATGFIGQHVVGRVLADPAWRVVAVTRKPGWQLPKPHRVVVGHWNESGLWGRALRGSDVVIHLAGAFGGDPQHLLRANVESTAMLLEACRQERVPRFMLASSSAVYGEPPGRASRESDPSRPTTLYGYSKWCAEELCRLYHRQHGIQCRLVRFANIYGPGATKGVVALFIQAWTQGRPIHIHGTGRQQRDVLFVDDAVEAVLALMRRPWRGCDVMNIGSGRLVTLKQLLAALRRATALSGRVIHDAPESHVTRTTWVDVRKARRDVAWAPRTPLAAGLAATANWWRTS